MDLPSIPGIPPWLLVLLLSTGGVLLRDVLVAVLKGVASLVRKKAAETPDKSDDARAEVVAGALDAAANAIGSAKPPVK